MTVYVVGDIQGCFSCLEKLLHQVHFNPGADDLWAVGDLVNRGPQSLETLRYCMSLGDSFRTVLGNHDLHLLAVARGLRAPTHKDTLGEILNAPDRQRILHWLQPQPLLLQHGDYTMVHAGIPPQWSIADAAAHAREVEGALAAAGPSKAFFREMYGNEPRRWADDLEGSSRLRCITNYLTRMRYCTGDGTLDLASKQNPATGPVGYLPWFAHRERRTRGAKIVFGHWASLNGVTPEPDLFALDTGCVWGGRLRLMSLANEHYHHLSCGQ